MGRGSRFDAGDRHNDDLVDAIDRAAHLINHTLAEGFALIARQMAISQGVDNSAEIEVTVKKIKGLTTSLNQSIPPN